MWTAICSDGVVDGGGSLCKKAWSTFHSSSSKNPVQGTSGVSRLAFINWCIRQATTRSKARHFFRLSASSSSRSSIRQPLLRIRWKSSMPHRNVYQRSRSSASSELDTATVVNSIHSIGSLTSGPLPTSRAYTRSEEHTSELQSRQYLACRLL